MKGLIAIVTGAGSGIGEAVCRSLADSGVKLILAGRRIDKLTEVASSLVTQTVTVGCDVREPQDVEHLVQESVNQFGQIDIVVNNAGIFRPTPIDETDVSDWDNVMSTNLRSAFLLSRAAWPFLKKSQGQIINISSIAATRGFSGGAAYCASKFGMNGLSAVLAIEGKPHGIRVLTLCPAQIDTPIWQSMDVEDALSKMMRPEQIGELVRTMLAVPRNIDLEPIVVTNFISPFEVK